MNRKSQQHTVGALLICFLMIIVSLSTGFVVYKGSIEAGEPNFEILGYDTQADYTNFNYSKKITLDHDQVPGDLTGFPVVINITDDSDMFSHCINNSGYDIAFFNATNETQFPHEIEYWNWDTGNSEVDACIWVNVSSLTAASDTIMYMYYGYDDTDQQDVAGTWDDDYLAVWHMNDASGTVMDSTSNNHDATVGNTPEAYHASGKIGYAIDFEHDNSDYLLVSNSSDLDGLSGLTLEAWIKLESDTDDGAIVSNVESGASGEQPFNFLFESSDNSLRLVMNHDSPGNQEETAFTTSISAGSWTYSVGGWNDGEKVYTGLNGGYDDASTNTFSNMADANGDTCISKRGTLDQAYLDGLLDEIRVSKINRSANWMLTTYNSQNNATNGSFFTFGSEISNQGGDASTYVIKGLPNDIITWAGTAGTLVYCNDTGDTNEWLEINMTINETDNVTGIRVFIDDLNDTDAFINASNITMYVSSDNSSYGELGTFTDGGSNLSINDTNWNFATMGDNPFNGTGLTDKNRSIYCIFKLTIPADSPTDIFFSAATTSYKIYLGHYT